MLAYLTPFFSKSPISVLVLSLKCSSFAGNLGSINFIVTHVIIKICNIALAILK